MTLFYFDCVTPFGEEPALISYQPDLDEPATDRIRHWNSGRAFVTAPPPVVEATIEEGEGGLIKQLYWSPVCLMAREVVAVLRAAGVTNLEVFDAKIHDFNSGEDFTTHQAVNIVGVGTAELALPMFRLVSGGVVVNAAVRDAVLAAGLETFELKAL